MNKKGEIGLGPIIMIFITIVVAIALLVPIFNTQADLTTKRTATNEVLDISGAVLAGGAINTTYPLTLTNAPTGWKTTGCPVDSFVIGNSSTDFTLTTDYTITASTGILYLKNTAVVNTSNAATNDSLVDYTWCADGYNTDSGARGIGGIIGLFAVLALFVVIAGAVKYDFI